MQTRQDYALSLAYAVGDHGPLGQFQLEGGLDNLAGNLQQLHSERRQVGGGQPQWPSSIASVSA